MRTGKSERKRVWSPVFRSFSVCCSFRWKFCVCLAERWWNVIICPILLLPSCSRPCPLFKGVWRMHWGFSCLGFLSSLRVYTRERESSWNSSLPERVGQKKQRKGWNVVVVFQRSQAPCPRIEKSESFLHLVMHPPNAVTSFLCRVVFVSSPIPRHFNLLPKKVCQVQFLSSCPL